MSEATLGAALLAPLVLLTLGGLVKYVPLALWPVLLAAAASTLPGWPQRIRLALVGGLVTLVVTVLAYVPYWQGWETLRNLHERGMDYRLSLPQGLWALLVALGADPLVAWPITRAVAYTLLLLAVAWATGRAWKRPDDVPSQACFVLLCAGIVFYPSPRQWYLLWAFAPCVLLSGRTRLLAGMGAGAGVGMLAYLVHSFLSAR
jgi:hypothetical protein